jgi:hypothetical protein
MVWTAISLSLQLSGLNPLQKKMGHYHFTSHPCCKLHTSFTSFPDIPLP